MKLIILRLVLLLTSLLLGSCLSGREEFWFERDGSGSLQAEYRLPNFAISSLGGDEKLRKTVADYFAKEPGVVLETFSIEKNGSESRLRLSAKFDSVLQLAKLLDHSVHQDESSGPSLPEPMVKLLGDVNVQRSGMNVDFKRRIDPREVFAGGLVTPTAKQMQGYQLEYIMHLPTRVSQSNAHQVLDDGHTLVWNYELADSMKHPVQTNFVAPIPIPPWVWLMVGILTTAIAWLVRRWFTRRTLSPV
ncbi:MAG: hypothetical protein RLZZ553_691 [Verrucomicrobiota bacterium]|jgi:hypothetical protein